MNTELNTLSCSDDTHHRSQKNFSEWVFPYLAGFLDGDGSIYCRIVSRPDYGNLFQLSPGISFSQKTSRIHHLYWIQSQLAAKQINGNVRQRPDGVSDFTLSGIHQIKSFLPYILPYIRIKHKQGILLQRILESLPSTKNSPVHFLQLCELADRISELNYSKNPRTSSHDVRTKYLSLKHIEKFAPVETE